MGSAAYNGQGPLDVTFTESSQSECSTCTCVAVKDRYKKANALEISLFAARHRRRNIKIENCTYTVTLLSTLADLDAAFRVTPTT